MRIRRRLVLYAIGVAALGMTLFAVLLAALLSRGVVTDQAEALAAIAAETATAVSASDPSADGAMPLVVADLRTSLDPFIVVLDDAGAVRLATARFDGAPPRIPAAVLVEASETGASAATFTIAPGLEVQVAAASYTRAADGLTGVVAAGQSTAFTEQQVAGLTAFLILSGLITVIAVAIVSYLVVGRALRPLRTLTVTVDEIRQTGDLSRRLAPTRSKDEVGVLTTSFNAMLDDVAAAQDRQAAALSAQRRFAADASHELRTPLTTIRTNAEFLTEHPDVGPVDRSEALADIAAESARMARLVDGLLTLARTDSGASPERRPVDLAGIALTVARTADRSVSERVVRLTSDGPAVVEGDTDLLTRLLWILVDNAIRHGAGEIDLDVRTADGSVLLTVADRGPGIAAEDRERVFERFAQTDASRTGDGAGLGLAIARSIVQAHGGTIEVRGRDGGGTVVAVELPAAD
jgi:two-component system OmpR family sensor kinase